MKEAITSHMVPRGSPALEGRGVPREWMAALRECPYFGNLADVELEMVGRLCSEATFNGGETLAASGARRIVSYLIVQGDVGLFFKGDGEDVPLDRLGPGDLVAPTALVASPPITSFVFRALSEVQALRIHGRDFLRLCDQNPRIGLEVMSTLVVRLNRRLFQIYHSLQRSAGSEALKGPVVGSS